MREQLLNLLRGKGAHMTFDEAVADMPIDAINARPPNVPYTFWHLVEHIRIAQWDILEFVRDPDHVSPEFPVGLWPARNATADQEQWFASIAAVQADLQAMQDLTADPDLDLLAEIPHAPGYTYLREILLVADHNAYHVGELAILRQVMGLWPADHDA